ncbi:MAG: hypothetical protein GX579_06855 [Chloroflexi bacterium]|jgi:DNA-directed RNA polymerase sigma subunit (sigma70/sigma32)|nr:hypothetical protein [Chloroflexota bacterium]
MVRRYGLLDGRPETLQSIGNSLQLSRERIRQLVQKRIQFHKRKTERAVHNGNYCDFEGVVGDLQYT